jgi:hypothetical protein
MSRSRHVRCYASAVQHARNQLITKNATATELVQQYLQRAQAVEPSLNSFVTIDVEGALQQVRRGSTGRALLLPCVPPPPQLTPPPPRRPPPWTPSCSGEKTPAPWPECP